MYCFIDESGDPGLKVDRGSSPYFTIAVAVFESAEAVRECQSGMDALAAALHMQPGAEFHFHSDSHQRRMALLGVLRDANFKISSFTLNKASPKLQAPGYHYKASLYKNVCGMALDNASALLKSASVVIDGSGERIFRQQLQQYLRRSMPPGAVARVSIKSSHSDPLLQAADYAAGVANRIATGAKGSDEYFAAVRRKFISRRVWP